MLGENVITRAVAKMDAKLATLEPEAIARLQESATLDHSEWFALGDMASRAMLDGKIDADTAQTLHVIHTGFTNGGATLAQRLVFMQAASELLAARIGR